MKFTEEQQLWLGFILEEHTDKLHDEFRDFQRYVKESNWYSYKKFIEAEKLVGQLIAVTEVLIKLWKNCKNREDASSNIAAAKSNLKVYREAKEFFAKLDEVEKEVLVVEL